LGEGYPGATLLRPQRRRGRAAPWPDLYFRDSLSAASAFAILNSTLFYAYFIAYGDCFHLNDWLVAAFPVPENLLANPDLAEVGRSLHDDLTSKAEIATINTSDGFQIAYAQMS